MLGCEVSNGPLVVLGQVVKFPFFFVGKLIVGLLNLVPTPVFEVFGIRGFNASNRPDLRSTYIQVKGRRRLNLGSALVAYQRGALFKADINTEGTKCWAVFAEDYEDIQKKWTF